MIHKQHKQNNKTHQQQAKVQDYLDLKKVAELMRTKDHLTTSGLEKIKEIIEGMNKKRK